jgi:hypothetical protein
MLTESAQPCTFLHESSERSCDPDRRRAGARLGQTLRCQCRVGHASTGRWSWRAGASTRSGQAQATGAAGCCALRCCVPMRCSSTGFLLLSLASASLARVNAGAKDRSFVRQARSGPFVRMEQPGGHSLRTRPRGAALVPPRPRKAAPVDPWRGVASRLRGAGPQQHPSSRAICSGVEPASRQDPQLRAG